MNDRTVTIKFTGDTKDLDAKAKASIKRLAKEIDALNRQSSGKSPIGIDAQRLNEYKRVVEQIRRIDEANAKAQIRQAEIVARTRADIKKSELRQFENAEKHKQRLAEISAKAQIQAANNAFKAQEAAKKREYQEFVRLEKEKTRIAQAEARRRASGKFSEGLNKTGGGMVAAGASFSATVTAPLVTLATLGTKAAIELDKVRQKFVGIEGSVEKANARIKELQDFAFGTKGVTTEQAFATFQQLKPLNISENVIRKQTQALGNLGQDADFSRNLLQIFQQNFERGDIKEAIGRMPLFETVLNEVAARFGQKDSAGLKKLKESGKLTLEQFLEGFSDAVNNNQNFARAGESLEIQLQKRFERLSLALVPLGDTILRVLLPALEKASPYIQQVGEYFSSLAPQIQIAIVAFGALAAAIGPVLIGLGAVVSALGTIAGAVGSIGLAPLLAGLAALATALAAVGVAAYAFYQAWTKNIGGIQEKTQEVFNNLKTIVEPAVAEVSEFVQQQFAAVIKWVDANLPTIIEAVLNVVKWIEKIWTENGEQIKAIVSATWTIIKTLVTTIGAQIGNAILLVANLINGNWSEAWKNFVAIVEGGTKATGTILAALVNIIYQLLKAGVIRILSIAKEYYDAAVSIGTNIAKGVKDGVTNAASEVYNQTKGLMQGVLMVMHAVPIIRSPSKVTTEIGEQIGEGLAVGIENKIGRAKSAAKKLAAETLKELQDAAKEFAKLAGASPGDVQRKIGANIFRQGASDLDEIIKLREQTGVGFDQPLPTTVAGAAAELKNLQRILKETEDRQQAFDDSMGDLEQSIKDTREAAKQAAEDFEKFKDTISQRGDAEVLNLQKEIDLLGVIDSMERQRIENAYDIQKLRQEMAADGYSQKQIDEAAELLRVEGARKLELLRILEIRKQVTEAGEIEKQLIGDLEYLQRGGRELTVYEETLQKINEDLRDIEPAQKQRLLDLAAEIDAVRELNKQHAELKAFFQQTFDYALRGDFKGLLENFTDRIRDSFSDKLSDFLATSVLGFDPKAAQNPLLSENKQHTKLLQQLVLNTGGVSLPGVNLPTGTLGGRGGGGFWSNLLNVAAGGSLGSRSGINSPLIFNAGGGGGGGMRDYSTLPIFTGGPIGSPTYSPGGSSGSGGFFDSLRNIFSTNPNGIFAPRTNVLTNKPDKWGGIIGGAGSLAQLLGSIIGGRGGRVLSYAGTGAQIGSMFGGIGAGIGAAAGALIGLFTGGTRKQDEVARTQAAQATLAELDKILAALNARPPQIQPPSSARSQADAILNEYRNAMNQLKDSKTRRIALDMLKPTEAIGYRSKMVDDAIKYASEWQKEADAKRTANQDRDRRLIPEFANGGAVSRWFSGLVPGAYDRRDDKLIRVSGSEVVLTPNVWKPIAPYLKQMNVPGFADGGMVSGVGTAAPKQPINVYINLKNTGIVESDIENIVVDSLDNPDVRVKVVKAYDREKVRVR